jgi:hypothetical protein
LPISAPIHQKLEPVAVFAQMNRLKRCVQDAAVLLCGSFEHTRFAPRNCSSNEALEALRPATRANKT